MEKKLYQKSRLLPISHSAQQLKPRYNKRRESSPVARDHAQPSPKKEAGFRGYIKNPLGHSDNSRFSEGLWTRIISAGFIVYRHTSEGPKFLLLYRGRGAWDMPRGRMESHEKSLQTAFREVAEETGLKRGDLILRSDFNRVTEKFPFSRKGHEKFFKIVIFYLAETKKSEIHLSDEHYGYAWFSLSEARKNLTRHKVRQQILKKAWDFIKKDDKPKSTIS